ncbi:hypothetical protein [Leptospira bandrabouensis]|uniref:hypothetical protein n=1 Tax=Leptospira bandrabouensis TaxID=2484903 RepID=UPI001EEAA643|nr:hypothetical protein [Leptospira bandrabouensis]MCG6152599.1 hypothetical protein [Leptospira bandrabouensis]
MKKSEFKKHKSELFKLISILENDLEILKMTNSKDVNLSYIEATILQAKEVNKSISLLMVYYEKKKIKF